MPAPEIMASNPNQVEEYCKIQRRFRRNVLEEFRSFPRLGRTGTDGAPDPARENARTRAQERPCGVQIYTNIAAGKPLDNPEFTPFWETMNKLGKPIWLHDARREFPRLSLPRKIKIRNLVDFGWSYETGAAMARLVFSKIMDNYPKLKIITHHFGGIVPMLEGRIGPGWDQIGARTSDEDLQALKKSLKKKRPLDYFKHSFYADTAAFTGIPATHAGFAFFDKDKIVFASDCPFDPEKGTMYIRETLKILDGIKMSKEQRKAIMYGNLENGSPAKFVK
jgi:aminocarboxymuconate-semialdehyde decarboxylase